MSGDLPEWLLRGEEPSEEQLHTYVLDAVRRSLLAALAPKLVEDQKRDMVNAAVATMNHLRAMRLFSVERISAGVLRGCGVHIPIEIPDFATVPRSAIRFETGSVEGNSNAVEMRMALDEPFSWVDLTVVLDPNRAGNEGREPSNKI